MPQSHKPAEISLTDCLACSGCVTSAEAVLVSLQSHAEVLDVLDEPGNRLYVASVSPQVRASIAATYKVSQQQAGWMIDQLLGGPKGLASGGRQGNDFKWIVDTNTMREATLVLGAEEITESFAGSSTLACDEGTSTAIPERPILSSACPGWICYAEKAHPHVLPHLSRLKSPQALTGTLLKTVLSRSLAIRPSQVWHLAVMPCFDKKLEASREELTDVYWHPFGSPVTAQTPVRDVDCVITARELLMLADTRGISFPNLPRKPLKNPPPFPDLTIDAFFFPDHHHSRNRSHRQPKEAGTSGGYLHHILATQLSLYPDAHLTTNRGRNADVIEYAVLSPSSTTPVFKAARYYGFRNIQNLVRKLKPPKTSRLPGGRGTRPVLKGRAGGGVAAGGTGIDYAYVEVMACPGGCTNGGGQIKIDDLPSQTEAAKELGQKEWLQRVDEAYFSMSDEPGDDSDIRMDHDSSSLVGDEINGISPSRTKQVLNYWATSTGIPLENLVKTSYRKVESDVGKVGGAGNEQIVESIAGKIGGGW